MIKYLALTTVFAVTGPAVAQEELKLDVMTFNIRFGIAYDGINNWPNRQDMVVNMLKEYDPDIIGTQELLPFQADYITQQLPEYRWFGAARGEGPLPERSAILYKWEEVIPLDSGTFWLSETPEIYGSESWGTSVARIATWGRFYHRETETQFFVYNTHFDHVSQNARINGMQVILDHIEEHTGEGEVILTGDFNVTAEMDPVYTNALTDTGFEDAWKVAEERVGPVATWNAFQPANFQSDRRIDWILTRGKITVERCETITYSENNRQLSDHFPVMASLQIDISSEE